VSDFQKMRALMQQMGQGGFPGMPGMFGGMGSPLAASGNPASQPGWRGYSGAAANRKRRRRKKKRGFGTL